MHRKLVQKCLKKRMPLKGGFLLQKCEGFFPDIYFVNTRVRSEIISGFGSRRPPPPYPELLTLTLTRERPYGLLGVPACRCSWKNPTCCSGTPTARKLAHTRGDFRRYPAGIPVLYYSTINTVGFSFSTRPFGMQGPCLAHTLSSPSS